MLCLRCWSISLGRLPWCSRMLRKVLVKFLIHRSKRKYIAATEYFDLKGFLKK